MNIQNEEYKRYADARAKKSPWKRNCLHAFLVGGMICLLGQLMIDLWLYIGLEKDTASALTSCSLVFLAVLLTGLGVFDKIAKFAGGGTLVPITGFANAMSSPAIDSRAEGPILGIGAKIFTVAGPVIAYGIAAGVVWGVIYYLACLIIG
jgi:stage V sporulation protein AC